MLLKREIGNDSRCIQVVGSIVYEVTIIKKQEKVIQ